MVFVSVREHDTAKSCYIFFDISDVRYNRVYTGAILFGKGYTAVHDYHVVAVFQDGHIFADFTDTAEEGNFNCFRIFCHFILHMRLSAR